MKHLRCVSCGESKPQRSFWASWNGKTLRETCSTCSRRAVCARYYRRKHEAVKATCAAYRARPEVKRRRVETARRYRLQRRAVAREQLRRWRAENPVAARRQYVEAAYVRRCRLAGVEVERFHRDSIFVRDKGLCAYCGLGLDPLNWHLDHVVAIANGGGHTRRNVTAACPACNMKKGARAAEAA